MLKAALAYAKEHSWRVLPLNGKVPFPRTHGHNDATTDEKQIRRWWRTYPNANVGIATGRASNLVVVDVDGPEGGDFLREMVTRGKRLPATREATSGRPGRRHLYFAYPREGDVRRALKVRPSLDILGDGGYVVAPPSIHPKTGKPYRWTTEHDLAALPGFIRRLVRESSHNGSAPPLPEIIEEGKRDDMLTSLAGSMRRRGASEEGILAALVAENARCSPPLDDADLHKIARSVARYPALPLDLSAGFTEISLANRFAKLEAGALRYCPSWHKWLAWDGTRWARDEEFEAERRVEAMVSGMIELATTVDDTKERERVLKELTQYTRRRKLDDVTALAKRRAALVTLPDVLDADPWLFNVENGTVDLRTGRLLKHDPENLITKLAPVEFDPRADCPTWHGFLRHIMNDDDEMLRFLQRAVGYTLAGVTHEHILLFCYGGGANGKSTMLEVLLALFGDYATTIDFETLLHQRYQSSESRRDLPRLHKARFVSANETPTSARWNERTVKQLTGGDTLSGRWLYQETFNFTPTHTLWCRGTDQPAVRDLTDAFWRRIKLVPFEVRIPEAEQVLDLKEQLCAELPGILNWAIEGCRAWQRDGLRAPARVRKATETYRQEQNVCGDFVAERCTLDPTAWTATAELYAAFRAWWIATHGPTKAVPSDAELGKALARHPSLQKKRQTVSWLVRIKSISAASFRCLRSSARARRKPRTRESAPAASASNAASMTPAIT